jgi:hypothetical protein
MVSQIPLAVWIHNLAQSPDIRHEVVTSTGEVAQRYADDLQQVRRFPALVTSFQWI